MQSPKSLERRLCELRERLRRLRVTVKGSGSGFDLEREIVLREEELAGLERTMHERFLGADPEEVCRSVDALDARITALDPRTDGSDAASEDPTTT